MQLDRSYSYHLKSNLFRIEDNNGNGEYRVSIRLRDLGRT